MVGKKPAAGPLGTFWLVFGGCGSAVLAGGVLGPAELYVIASGSSGFSIHPSKAGAFATNGYAERSPGGYSLPACLVAEVVPPPASPRWPSAWGWR